MGVAGDAGAYLPLVRCQAPLVVCLRINHSGIRTAGHATTGCMSTLAIELFRQHYYCQVKQINASQSKLCHWLDAHDSRYCARMVQGWIELPTRELVDATTPTPMRYRTTGAQNLQTVF
jgi:hypothetical protein